MNEKTNQNLLPKPQHVEAEKQPLDQATINRFLDLQVQELQQREKRLGIEAEKISLQKSQDNNLLQYSLKALEANQKDRQAERDAEKSRNRSSKIFIVILLLIVVAFFVVCIFQNKEHVINFIIEKAVYVIGGFLGGRGYQNFKSKNPEKKADDQSEN